MVLMGYQHPAALCCGQPPLTWSFHRHASTVTNGALTAAVVFSSVTSCSRLSIEVGVSFPLL